MKELFEALLARLEKGLPMVMVSVIESSGSARAVRAHACWWTRAGARLARWAEARSSIRRSLRRPPCFGRMAVSSASFRCKTKARGIWAWCAAAI